MTRGRIETLRSEAYKWGSGVVGERELTDLLDMANILADLGPSDAKTLMGLVRRYSIEHNLTARDESGEYVGLCPCPMCHEATALLARMPTDAEQLARLKDSVGGVDSEESVTCDGDAIRRAIERIGELERALHWYRDRDSEAMLACKGITRCDCDGCVGTLDLLDGVSGRRSRR